MYGIWPWRQIINSKIYFYGYFGEETYKIEK